MAARAGRGAGPQALPGGVYRWDLRHWPSLEADSVPAACAMQPVPRCPGRAGASFLAPYSSPRAPLFAGRGEFAEAAQLYALALESAALDDKRARTEMLAGRAACHRRARALHAAIADCDAALRLFPRYKRALFRRAACLMEANRPREACAASSCAAFACPCWPGRSDT